MFLSEWREFPSASCLAGKNKLMTARVSMLLKSRASLICFQVCFLPGRARDLSAPRYGNVSNILMGRMSNMTTNYEGRQESIKKLNLVYFGLVTTMAWRDY